MPEVMPSLFISHGAPTLALEDTPTSDFMKSLADRLHQPAALVMVSAHWETMRPMLTGAAKPGTIHDFHGFPKALYDLRYRADGHPALANRIQSILADAGFEAGIDDERGLDHGAWNPLLLAYPDAVIPVIQLSIQPKQDARWHYLIGQALSPLREENILIIGSGNMTHNLRAAMAGVSETPEWVSAFSDWVAKRLEEGDVASLLRWQQDGPHAAQNHPTPEHFLPFFVALGAAGGPVRAVHLHQAVSYGVLAMDAYAFYPK